MEGSGTDISTVYHTINNIRHGHDGCIAWLEESAIGMIDVTGNRRKYIIIYKYKRGNIRIRENNQKGKKISLSSCTSWYAN